jgi:hypothetical protein
MTPSWRKFEQLVARAEQLLAPKGANIKSPDYIPDLVTGQKREVDASIRFQVGSVPILITIECRERTAIQDDTWIEQLATKREKIGAAKTIAVSATGFTQPATKSAQHYGIELRRIDDITDSEIAKQWAEGIVIETELFEYSLISAAVHFDMAEKIYELELSPSIQEAFKKNPMETEMIFEKATDKPYTISDLVAQLHFDDIVVGMPKVRRDISLKFPKSTCYSVSNQGKIDIIGLDLALYLELKRECVPLTNIIEYSTLEKPLVHMAESVIELGSTKKLIIEVSKNLK